MTTSRTFADNEGEFRKEKPTDIPCRKCGKTEVTYQIWESSDGAYEDCRYTCQACRTVWWVDGIDS
jgi:hypothetical protein